MKQQKKFEDIINELETIVQDLDGQIDLEESLQKFSSGMKLAQEAEARLKQIENQFETLKIKFESDNKPEPTSDYNNDLTS